jgi:hypothetical protein
MSYNTFACLNVCYGGLPQEMICKGCMETSKEEAIQKGICLDKNDTRTTKTTCQQPFHLQWRNHYHQKKQLMFARVRAYILQHSAVSASDPLSAIEVKTPLAPIDANANGG